MTRATKANPVRFTTWCGTCKDRVGAQRDSFSNHRSAQTLVIWKTSAHKDADGRPCLGSRLQVPTETVTDRKKDA